MAPRRTARSSLVALLISGALHVGVLWWVSGQQLPPLETPNKAQATLVFIEPPPPPAPVEPPTPPPPPQTKTQTKQSVTRPTPPVEVARVEPPRAAPAPSDRPDVPTVSLTPSLFDGPASSSFLFSVDAGTLSTSVEVRRGLHGLDRPADLVGDIARETVGRGKVDRGLVHSYYADVGKVLIKGWDADRAVSKQGLKGLGEQFIENSKTYNEIWLDRAAAFGRSGSPLDGDSASGRRAPVNDRIGGLPGPDLDARKELSKQMREAYKATRRAVIRVVQDPSGKLVRVELVQPSNDLNVDREALKDVQAAAERMPAPPPEVVAGHKELASLWSFELVVSISPPVPTFTFEFDEALGFIDARLPLDRRIYKKVRLLAVE